MDKIIHLRKIQKVSFFLQFSFSLSICILVLPLFRSNKEEAFLECLFQQFIITIWRGKNYSVKFTNYIKLHQLEKYIFSKQKLSRFLH